MTLDQWLERQGDGARHRLMFEARVSYPTIQRAREGRASLESATKIHAATGGKVPIGGMVANAGRPAVRRKSKSVRRRVRSARR